MASMALQSLQIVMGAASDESHPPHTFHLSSIVPTYMSTYRQLYLK